MASPASNQIRSYLTDDQDTYLRRVHRVTSRTGAIWSARTTTGACSARPTWSSPTPTTSSSESLCAFGSPTSPFNRASRVHCHSFNAWSQFLSVRVCCTLTVHTYLSAPVASSMLHGDRIVRNPPFLTLPVLCSVPEGSFGSYFMHDFYLQNRNHISSIVTWFYFECCQNDLGIGYSKVVSFEPHFLLCFMVS